MKQLRLIGCALIVSVVALLAGCATIPQAIKGTSPQPQQDLTRIMTNPPLFFGQESRFGGRVVEVLNRDNTTRMELVVHPLDELARPILGSGSLGRVYADAPNFIDPTELKNQYVTVLGTIDHLESGKVDQQSYQFLVIKVTGYQRWHLSQQVMAPPVLIDPWIWNGPNYHHGVIDPWWGYPMQGPMPVQTFLTE